MTAANLVSAGTVEKSDHSVVGIGQNRTDVVGRRVTEVPLQVAKKPQNGFEWLKMTQNSS